MVIIGFYLQEDQLGGGCGKYLAVAELNDKKNLFYQKN